MMVAPCGRYGSAALQSQNMAYTFVRNVASSCSVVRSAIATASVCLPATFTRMSMPPSWAFACSIKCMQKFSSRNVARQCYGLAPGCGDEFDDFARIQFFRREIIKGDIGAFARKRDRHGTAYAAISTGNNGAAPGQPAKSLVRSLAMVRLRDHFVGEPWCWLRLLLEFRLRILFERILNFILVQGLNSEVITNAVYA